MVAVCVFLHSPHMGLMSNVLLAVLVSDKHFGAICIDQRVFRVSLCL